MIRRNYGPTPGHETQDHDNGPDGGKPGAPKRQPSFEAKHALAIELLDTFDFLKCTRVCEEAPPYSLFFWKNGGKKKSEHTGLIQSHIRNSAKNIHPDDRKYNHKKPANTVINVPSETVLVAETLAQMEATAANFISISKCIADVHLLHQMMLHEKKSIKEIVTVLPHIKAYNGRMIQQAYERFNQNNNKDSDLKKVFGAGLLTEKNLFACVADDHLRGCLRILVVLTRRGFKLSPTNQATGVEEEMAAPLIRWTSSLGEQVARYLAESVEHGTKIFPHIICSGGVYFLYVEGQIINVGESSSHALDCFFKSFLVFNTPVPGALRKLLDFIEIVAYKTLIHSQRATVNKLAKLIMESLEASTS